jgi:ribosomal protein L7Ae-like RNA K-turn-binding protein
MIKYTKAKLVLTQLFVLGIAFMASAQLHSDTVMMAMKDELKRSMSELQYKEYEKPFYINYGIDDIIGTNITASLGAIVNSSGTPIRTKYIRVMAGDYEFNDESLDVEINRQASDGDTWQVPSGNDYYGIRRSLWLSTDQVYKSASRLFNLHTKYVESEGKSLEEIPHRRFDKVPLVAFKTDKNAIAIDKKALEEKAKALSALFLQYPDLHSSTVSIMNYNTLSYFANSEGSTVQTYKNMASMQISAAKLSPEGQPVFKRLSYIFETPAELLALTSTEKDLHNMVKQIDRNMESPKLDDSYEGPVLFLDEAVPAIFRNNIIGKFKASDIKAKSGGFGVQFNPDPFDDKINEKVTSTKLNISLLPKLKEYEGEKLLGRYDVDDEGVVPNDEIVLVKDGILKNVMTTRTLAKDWHKSTGTGSGPGVVSIFINETAELEALKDDLIAKAKEEELDYAIIVRKIELGRILTCNVYKVSLEDGSEEFLTAAQLSDFGIKSLKKIVSASKDRKVYNYPNRSTGGAVSYIVPTALLIEDVEIEKSYQRFNVELPLVESPQ